MNKRIITLVALACLSLNAYSEDIQLQKNHPERYTVVKGDTLSHIAKHFYGKAGKWPDIYEANRDQLDNPDRIKPGQVLKIPSLDDGTA